MTVKCLGICYEEGNYQLYQRVKKGTKTTYKHGGTQRPRKNGGGWGEDIQPSHLILYFEADGKKGFSWIDYYFKKNIGRLTEKRRSILELKMPTTVEVEAYERQDGSTYYVVNENDLENWLIQSGLRSH